MSNKRAGTKKQNLKRETRILNVVNSQYIYIRYPEAGILLPKISFLFNYETSKRISNTC